MSASESYLNAITRLGEAKAQAQAEAARQNGQIWGSTIANIGQMVAQYPEQQAKLKEIANRADLTNLERQREQRINDEQQRGIQQQQQMSAAFAKMPRNADGSIDPAGLNDSLQGLSPDAAEKLVTSVKNINAVGQSYQQEQKNKVADAADVILKAHTPDEPITPDAVEFHLQALKPFGLVNDQDISNFHQAVQSGADPRVILKSLRSQGAKYQRDNAPYTLSEGQKRFDENNQLLAENPKIETPKTPEEVLFDSLNPNSKTKDISAAAVQKKADDAAAALKNKPLTPYEQSEQVNSDRNFKLATQRYNLAVKNSDKPAASKASVDLVDTVIAHPELWNQLTPTQKGALAQGLDAKGFSGFSAKEPAAMETRLASSKAVLQTGGDMVKLIKENAAELGPLMGRYNSVADFVGNPPPKFKELAGLIESYSLANMGVHGMRSANASEAIKQTIGEGKQTPESMIATITGLNGFAGHLLQNEGRDVPGGPPAMSGGVDVTAPNGKTYHFASQGQADAFKAKAGIK